MADDDIPFANGAGPAPRPARCTRVHSGCCRRTRRLISNMATVASDRRWAVSTRSPRRAFTPSRVRSACCRLLASHQNRLASMSRRVRQPHGMGAASPWINSRRCAHAIAAGRCGYPGRSRRRCGMGGSQDGRFCSRNANRRDQRAPASVAPSFLAVSPSPRAKDVSS